MSGWAMKRLVFIVNDSEATIFVVGDGYEDAVDKDKRKASTTSRTWITLDNPVAGFPRLRELLDKSSDGGT